MNELALFSGAGGGILGSHLLGWKTVCAVEWADYPRKVLFARQRDGILPRFPIWDDVQTFDGKQWKGRVDIVTGGFPCQDISMAGHGKGIDGERSGLWTEMHRIISEVRPMYALMENSPAITSRGLGRVLGDLAEIGYDAKWSCFTGREIGSTIKRERWFCLATDAGSYEKPFKYTKSNLLNKAAFENQFWSVKKFAALLDSDKARMPVVSGDERVVNGIPGTVDRLAVIGNAQIPGVVALAFKTLSGL